MIYRTIHSLKMESLWMLSFDVSTVLLCVAVIVTIYLFFLRKKVNYNYPPGPRGLPIVGNIFSLLFTKLAQPEVLYKWSEAYGKVYTFRLLGSRIVILNDLELIQEAFHGPDINDRLRTPPIEAIHRRENAGIAFANGTSWKEQRRFFLTIFRRIDTSVIKMEDIVSSQASRFLTELEDKKGEEFDPTNIVTVSVANVILKIVTGVTYDYDDEKFLRIAEYSKRLFEIIGPSGLWGTIPYLASLPLPSNLELTEVWKKILGFVREHVDEHKARFDPDEPATDFITCYLKEMHGNSKDTSFDDVNILETCLDAIIGGYETATNSLRWIMHTLAAHPDDQSRVRQELCDVVGRDRLPTFADRHNLPLTEATIAECMRRSPVVAIHIPHIASDDCTIGGYDVPKGSCVIGNLWFLALSPKLWDKPNEFLPGRFLDESGSFNRTMEAIPFGYGRRVCPGEQLARMEIFVFITHLLQRFSLELPEGCPTKLDGKSGFSYNPVPYKIRAVEV